MAKKWKLKTKFRKRATPTVMELPGSHTTSGEHERVSIVGHQVIEGDHWGQFDVYLDEVKSILAPGGTVEALVGDVTVIAERAAKLDAYLRSPSVVQDALAEAGYKPGDPVGEAHGNDHLIPLVVAKIYSDGFTVSDAGPIPEEIMASVTTDEAETRTLSYPHPNLPTVVVVDDLGHKEILIDPSDPQIAADYKSFTGRDLDEVKALMATGLTAEQAEAEWDKASDAKRVEGIISAVRVDLDQDGKPDMVVSQKKLGGTTSQSIAGLGKKRQRKSTIPQ